MILTPEQIDKLADKIHKEEIPEFIDAHMAIQMFMRDLIHTAEHYIKKNQDIGGVASKLTDAEQKVVKAINKEYSYGADRVNIIMGIINDNAGCQMGATDRLNYLFKIIEKLSNQKQHKYPAQDDFVGLDELADSDRINYIKKVRIKARDIIDNLEPHHIDGVQTLKEKLERALDDVKLMENLLEHNFED
jgi:hypothetical protein